MMLIELRQRPDVMRCYKGAPFMDFILFYVDLRVCSCSLARRVFVYLHNQLFGLPSSSININISL